MTDIPSLEALYGHLASIHTEHRELARPGQQENEPDRLILNAWTGERLLIGVKPEPQIDNLEFQRVSMSIHPGRNQDFPFGQVAYHFNKSPGEAMVSTIPKTLLRPGFSGAWSRLSRSDTIRIRPIFPVDIGIAFRILRGAAILNPDDLRPVTMLDSDLRH